MAQGSEAVPPWERWRGEMERWLHTARHSGERALEAFGAAASGRTWPAVDIFDSGSSIVVRADVPGVSIEQINVALVGQVLTIGVDRPQPELGAVTPILRECFAGKHDRSIPLPMPVDPQSVTAELHQGVLTVRLGKPTPSESRAVPIRVVPASPATPAETPAV